MGLGQVSFRNQTPLLFESVEAGKFQSYHVISHDSQLLNPLRTLRYGSYQYSQQYSQEQSIKQKQQEIMQQQKLSTLGMA